jgi:hypothetical protein
MDLNCGHSLLMIRSFILRSFISPYFRGISRKGLFSVMEIATAKAKPVV